MHLRELDDLRHEFNLLKSHSTKVAESLHKKEQ